MKNKSTTIILAVVLVALSVIGYVVSKQSSESSSSIDVRDRHFAVEDRDEVAKILIAQRNGKKVIIEKKGGKWFADESFEVHPNVIGNLLDVISGVELKYIPPRSAYDNMMKAIGRLGIKVEIYREDGQLLKGYQVGGTTAGELGTVFLMDGYTQPYVLQLPNFEGSLRGRFLIDHIDQIRDRTVFAYEKEDIKEIAIHYPKDSRQSFRVRKDDGEFRVLPYQTDAFTVKGDTKPGAIQGFIRAFQDVDAEAFENAHPLKDSIQSLVPIAEIYVTDMDSEVKSVRLFSVIDVFNVDINTRGVDKDKRVERYFADCSWGEFMIVQDLLFRKILWKYEEFY